MSTTGLIAIAAALTVGIGVGLWRRRTDGRLRPADGRGAGGSSPGRAPGSDPVPVVAPAAGSGGSPPPAGPDVAAGAGPGPAAEERIDPALLVALGVEPARATLLQFSTAFCAPCRALRRVAGDVAGMIPGVRHVEVDAESHLDAVRALDVWRTPTLFVLDADGRIVRRASGVPGKPQLIAVLGEILTEESAPGRR